jgi:DNA recombination protein RmuC
MMTDLILGAAIVLLLVVIGMLVPLLRRPGQADLTGLLTRFDTVDKGLERSERGMDQHARGLREEVQGSLKLSTDMLVQSVEQIFQSQQTRLADFTTHLHAVKAATDAGAAQLRTELATSLKDFGEQLTRLTDSNVKKADELRLAVDHRLKELQADNSVKLEEMRRTVDEKLQGTLEKRLGESFKQVSDRLEQVHKGLGEMQTLANGVGDLKRVLTNVKTRGTWAEVQLGNLLDQVLTPDQYARNVATKPNSRELVEFALRLPGRDDRIDQVVWLPIDAKFPKEAYERLTEAAERGDAVEVERAAAELETRVRGQARDIRDKYIDPPSTTEFALLYLPTEGLYAEIVRRPGLIDTLQREFRVNLVGPTTLGALLNSLQMGFRTLAIQKQSSEVWRLLGAVKNEFVKFGDILEKVKKKIDETGSTIEDAVHRSRQLEKKLKKVEALPAADASALLQLEEAVS